MGLLNRLWLQVEATDDLYLSTLSRLVKVKYIGHGEVSVCVWLADAMVEHAGISLKWENNNSCHPFPSTFVIASAASWLNHQWFKSELVRHTANIVFPLTPVSCARKAPPAATLSISPAEEPHCSQGPSLTTWIPLIPPTWPNKIASHHPRILQGAVDRMCLMHSISPSERIDYMTRGRWTSEITQRTSSCTGGALPTVRCELWTGSAVFDLLRTDPPPLIPLNCNQYLRKRELILCP